MTTNRTAEGLSEEELVLEVIHDLTNRYMLADTEGYGGREPERQQAAALRRLLDELRALRSRVAELELSEGERQLLRDLRSDITGGVMAHDDVMLLLDRLTAKGAGNG